MSEKDWKYKHGDIVWAEEDGVWSKGVCYTDKTHRKIGIYVHFKELNLFAVYNKAEQENLLFPEKPTSSQVRSPQDKPRRLFARGCKIKTGLKAPLGEEIYTYVSY